MKKLFTLAAAILASFSMWAADPTLAIGTESQTTATFLGEYATEGLTLSSSASYSSGAVQLGNTPSSYDQHYFEVLSASDYIDSISFLISGNGSNKSIQAPVFAWEETATGNTADTYVLLDAKTVTANSYGAAQWFTYDLSNAAVKCARLYRTTKGISSKNPEYTGSSTALGSGQTIKIYGLKIWTKASCTDPEFTVPEGGTGFVGDPIDLAITSKNNSKPVKYAVTVDGVEGVNGTDYSFNVSPGLVQATPLKAGTFVITFSQASDGTYCDAEESATFVISEKSPVTSFEIDAPATAHVGEEVTIELKNFDAAPTTIVWYDGEFVEIEAANGKTSYSFTPEAAGEYIFQITAWNAYNALNEEAFNYTVINVAVGTDATLSDLKVNGATIDGFAADKYEYNIELGVYEALNVEATAADAPYASAEVVDNGEGKITITVTAQNKSTQAYVINYTRGTATELASISASATWDFTKTGAKEVKFTDETIVKKGVTEFNFADVLTSPDASFNAAALNGIGEYAVREGKYFQGSYLKFQTTVPGKLEVIYCNTGNRAADQGLERILTVNGTKIGEGALRSDTDVTESDIAINAGSVEISSVLKNDESIQYIRVKKVTFTKDEATALDNTEASVKAVKFFQNGQLFIEKNGKVYTIIGSEIR